MITIYYIPDKTGKAFIAPTSDDICLMDTSVVDTVGLVKFIEEELGIFNHDYSFNERLCKYYKLVRNWLRSHPDNVLNRSFNLAHLSTTRQMLLWRDALKMAQWDFEYEDTTSRLGALADIESIKEVKGLPDRIITLCCRLEVSEKRSFEDWKLKIPFERCILRPIVRRLLDALENSGAQIELISHPESVTENLSIIKDLLSSDGLAQVKLTPDDTSFEVMKFETKSELMEYMTVCQQELKVDIWIDSNNKEIDNRLVALNMPTSGSVITSRSRVLNLMSLTLSLFDENLQINKLVEWFSAPVHPLPGRFRFQLAEQIARSGGFVNKSCLSVIDKYINGDFEYPNEKDKELTLTELEREMSKRRKDREDKVKTFIPYLYSDYQTPAQAEKTLLRLSAWARQRVATLPDDDDREALAIQLMSLANSIDILMLLFTESNEPFNLALANEWIKYIPTEITLPNHPARVGCTFTITTPTEIVTPVKSVLWSNMESRDAADFDCGFLFPGERSEIIEHAQLWDISNEGRYRFECSVYPFLMTSERIILAYALKDGPESIVPHPIITRLKSQIANYEEFEQSPSLVDKLCINVEGVDNSSDKPEYRFINSEKINIPVKMSATGLESITLYPFDFLFERILNYQSAGLSSLPELHTTRGTVAHATIARLFSPRGEEKYTNSVQLQSRFSAEYEDALRDAIKECGAIFMLPENKLELRTLHYQLKQCIENLIEIIGANGLKVESSERHYSKCIGICPENNPDGNDDLHGYLDMKLIDADGNHIVFDFKWTGSRSYHKGLLEKNRSSQLAVYAELVKEEGKIVKTAYFTMPKGRLISTYHFRGRNVDVVTPENTNNILEQLANSYRFRRNQILSGILEEGELNLIEELQYEIEREKYNLFPLPGDWNDDSVKCQNKFSNYALFKGLK